MFVMPGINFLIISDSQEDKDRIKILVIIHLTLTEFSGVSCSLKMASKN